MRTEIKLPSKESLLHGHTSPETAYLVEDYPFGYKLRCKIRYWIESKKGKGQRFVSQTTDPRKGNTTWNKPKASTYSQAVFLYLDENNHVKALHFALYHEEHMKQNMDFLLNTVGIENISKESQEEIRSYYAMNAKINYGYRVQKYSTDEKKEEYKQWTINTVKHALKCEFKDLMNHEPAPEPDQPEEQAKMTITEY